MAQKITTEELKKAWGEQYEEIVKFIIEKHQAGAGPDEIAEAVRKRFPGRDCMPDWPEHLIDKKP